MSANSIAAPAAEMLSDTLRGSGLPMSRSMISIAILPPSSGGIGKHVDHAERE